MKELDLIVPNPTGLHARPAKVFVKTAKQFKADIRVKHGSKKVNAKSVISVLTLGVEMGGTISIVADGPDEDEALAVLKDAVETGLGDDLSVGHAPAPKPEKAKTNGQVDAAPAPASAPPPPVAKQTPALSGDKIVRAIPAAAGIAIGPLHQFKHAEITIEETAADPETEKSRLEKAIDAARTELEGVLEQVKKQLSGSESEIFEAHLEILDDPELKEAAVDNINNGQSAGHGWQAAVESVASTMAALKDETLAARAVDFRDVGNRVLRALSGGGQAGPELPDHSVILIANDLTPSDTVALNPGQVLGFCTAIGGANGHTAILARAMGIPAMVGAGEDIFNLENGVMAILNGDTGTLTISPDEEALAKAKGIQEEHEARNAAELAAAKEPAITKDDHRVEVVANIGDVKEARKAMDFGAEGVGLLRTEFLFLERDKAPTEDEQFEVYRDILLAQEGQPVIARTLDVGGDKPLAYLPVDEEENPFLGQRGIRLCLARPELLRTQLRALLRASSYGRLRIMFPMITTFEDWTAAKRMVAEIQNELRMGPVELGIMIEVPAAALLAPAFAREVDFFSIGTNDLTQYTLAMDRTNPALSEQADGLNPAVLSLIDRTVKASHSAGKWTGVCGELAANPIAVPILVGLGVDELSCSVPAIPAVKAQVRTLARSTAEHLAAQALACATATEVRRTVESLL
ncbi:MAG: phosphoenolpyruvate--protein phosphotransferase [Anaerolineae bacterium]|nr:phosphoenolpyruvate--protein phosphotransferase [Anaerolineae bacterium]